MEKFLVILVIAFFICVNNAILSNKINNLKTENTALKAENTLLKSHKKAEGGATEVFNAWIEESGYTHPEMMESKTFKKEHNVKN